VTKKEQEPEPSKKKPSIFDDPSDDLFKSSPKKLIETSKPSTTDEASQEESQTIEEKKPAMSSVKNIGKSLVFGPGALSSSKLFKKLSDQNKEVVEDAERLEEESGSSNVSFDAFLSDSLAATKTSVRLIQEASGDSTDIFGDLTVDRAFTENTLKNAQKVNKSD